VWLCFPSMTSLLMKSKQIIVRTFKCFFLQVSYFFDVPQYSNRFAYIKDIRPAVYFTTTQQQPFYGPLSRTTRVSRYQKKHSPTHHPDHHPIFISFFHLPRSIASSLFKLHAWQSFCTTSFHALFGLPLGLEPSI